MSIDLEKLSLDELIALNKQVIRRINYMQSLKTRSQLDRFEVGDRVGFQKDGRMVEGMVTRVNRRSLSVCTLDNDHWNIHPGFLTKLSDAQKSIPSLIDKLFGRSRS